jgi:D-serine deaminase-like pyridoxal phosphate-dependent protein
MRFILIVGDMLEFIPAYPGEIVNLHYKFYVIRGVIVEAI